MKPHTISTSLFALLITFLCTSCYDTKPTRENGWYHLSENGELSAEPIVTVKEFSALKLDQDYYGKYVISGQISKHKINKWAYETERSIGNRLAFVLDDSIVTDPTVNARIESGAFMITSLHHEKLPDIYRRIIKEMQFKH